ncbi:MAG: hypothetical protein KatS3mg105_5051 [Gemmatales bacterium]|nr:MAG: hypothetical protein KatS3mg105_5051 [Gemmatales bacterium]
MRDFTVLQLRDPSEWLRLRKRFITSTDAPVILQASPWKGPAQLWAEKLNCWKKPRVTELMQQGIDLESWILAKVPEQFPDLPPLKPAKDFYLSNRFHNFACSLDAWAQEERTIVEIKTASKHIYWKMDGKLEVPIYYKIQVNFQMLVTGFSKAYVVVFFRDTKELHCLEVRSDPVLQDNIISGCKNFWACMKSRTPPMPDHYRTSP